MKDAYTKLQHEEPASFGVQAWMLCLSVDLSHSLALGYYRLCFHFTANIPSWVIAEGRLCLLGDSLPAGVTQVLIYSLLVSAP
jgi:hypothetical protein